MRFYRLLFCCYQKFDWLLQVAVLIYESRTRGMYKSEHPRKRESFYGTQMRPWVVELENALTAQWPSSGSSGTSYRSCDHCGSQSYWSFDSASPLCPLGVNPYGWDTGRG